MRIRLCRNSRLKERRTDVDCIKVNIMDLIPVVLLLLFLGLTLAGGVLVAWLVLRGRRRPAERHATTPCSFESTCPFVHARSIALPRPASWMVVRSRNPRGVQRALGLNHAKPCTWTEGLGGERGLFIAPPVNGWILIVGSGLPDPNQDIDACFRFLSDFGRKIGQLQFFHANRVLNHHAWVRVEAGRVVRAYAWAGRTLWNQGVKTRAERELGLNCFQYFEPSAPEILGRTQVIAANTQKVPLLAARWSFDPAALDERLCEHACGIAGEPSRRY
jgi:hypothetical protein